MKNLLKFMSVIELLIGALGLFVGILALVGAGVLAPAVETGAQEQVLMLFRVQGIVAVLSALFNLACGFAGLKGAKGDQKKLKLAIRLGWIGFIMAVISAALVLIGNVNASSLTTAIASAAVPVVFLFSAKSADK